MDHRIEAAELAQEVRSRFRMPADLVELGVREGSRLAKDRARDDELADVVEQPADREGTKPSGRHAQLLPHLGGEPGYAPGVLLGRGVLAGERDEERADLRAEECLLRLDELRAAEVPPERT